MTTNTESFIMWRAFSIVLIVSSIFLSVRAESFEPLTGEPISPLPKQGSVKDSDKVYLGSLLFHDVKLSKNNTISCASCHDLSSGGADGKMRSVGLNGSLGDINAPTVLNSGFNFRQFWNGRARTLEDQVEGPVQHPKEMGAVWDDVIVKLKADVQYLELFKAAYKDGVTKENIKSSIAAFERSLVTPNARFDRYLLGERDVLTALEKKGYERFKTFGCVACHQGTNIGGNMFQTMGVMGKYFADRGTPITDADLGRFTVTKKEQDKHVFRVPSLRNVALTAPYFHDGSAKRLEDAISVMAKYQLGRRLSKDEIDSLTAFLRTLTGDMPTSVKLKSQKAASK